MGGMMGPGGNGMTQDAFRFRTDDGTEVDQDPANGGAPWLGAIDADISLPLDFGRFRLRIAGNFNDSIDVDKFWDLEYSYNGASYLTIQGKGTAPGDRTVHLGSRSKHLGVDNNDDTTEYTSPFKFFLGPWADTTNNCVVTDSNFDRTGQINFPGLSAPQGMSTEWCLQIPPAGTQFEMFVGDTVEYRLFVDNGAPFTGGYDVTPKVTLLAASPLPPKKYIPTVGSRIWRR